MLCDGEPFDAVSRPSGPQIRKGHTRKIIQETFFHVGCVYQLVFLCFPGEFRQKWFVDWLASENAAGQTVVPSGRGMGCRNDFQKFID
jgi:hypothetical protein